MLYLCALWLYLCLSISYSQFTRAKPRLPLFLVALGLLALLAHRPADRRVDRVHGARAPHFKQDLGRRRDAATRVGEEACNVPALALVLALCKVPCIVACAWAGKLQNEKATLATFPSFGCAAITLAWVLVPCLLVVTSLKAHDEARCAR